MITRALLGLLALTFAVSGCGKAKDKREKKETQPAVAESDELIPLKIRAIRQTDRLPTALPQAGLTVVPHQGPDEPEVVAQEIARLEPGGDWRSENMSAAAARRLSQALASASDVGEIASENFTCSDLRPGNLAPAGFRGGFAILRAAAESAENGTLQGPARLTEAIADLRTAFDGARMESSLKPIGVEMGQGEFATTFLVELRGAPPGADGRKQVNATWHSRWTDTDPPRLLALELRDYQEAVLANSAHAARFLDATSHVLGRTPHFASQILTGVDHWAARITRLGDFSLTGHHGLAVGDVNGDGREDLFVCDGGSLPNRLYMQEVDGSARDVSAQAGVDWLEDSRSALLVDLDNDGDQDLVVATIAMIAFAENDGAGNFTLRGGHPGAPYGFSLSAADYDNDGFLDIYACVYSAGDNASARGFEASSPLPFNDAENGGRNVLLKNLGAFRFANVTARTGLDQDNTRWSFAAAWEDLDRDGDPDLYVANDFGRNCLYRNEGGRFHQIAAQAGVEDMASGMSVAWGDYDRDGAPDLYVGNMFSAAGGRVSYQRAFAQQATAPQVKGLQRMARGNSLFQWDGAGGFRDVSEASGTTMGRWAWSSGFVDVNNDGWEDLAVANGYLTGREPDDL